MKEEKLDKVLITVNEMIDIQLIQGYKPGEDDEFWAKDTAHVIACIYDLEPEDEILKLVEDYVKLTYEELRKKAYFNKLEEKGPFRRSLKENAEYEALKLYFLSK